MLSLLTVYHWLLSSFQVKAKIFTVAYKVFSFVWHLVTSLCSCTCSDLRFPPSLCKYCPCCSSDTRYVLSQGLYNCFFLHLIFTSSGIGMVYLPSPSGFCFNGSSVKFFLWNPSTYIQAYLSSLLFFFFFVEFSVFLHTRYLLVPFTRI